MKSIKSLAVISLVLFTTEALACVFPSYEPSEYYLFRLTNKQEWIHDTYNIYEHENCILWQQQTLPCFSLEDIKEVVYRYKLETLEQLKEGFFPQEAYGNDFAHWLKWTKNDEVLDFLILAKTCEWLRLEHQSPWYYPSKCDPVQLSLGDVVETALSHNKGPLAERYALQAVRAMISLRRYDECIKYWEETASHFPDGLMRQMIEPYVAGAYYHIGNIDKAKHMFAQLGDTNGLLLCENKGNKSCNIVESMELIYETLPDCPRFKLTIQNLLGHFEPNLDWESLEESWHNAEEINNINQLEKLCDRVLNEGRATEPAIWAYTACYIAHLKGDDRKADQYLSIAEKTVKDESLRASVKVMRIFIDAKLCTYNKVYEQKLFDQLVWLQQQVEEHITCDVQEKAGELTDLLRNTSFYYWNDAMRCILLGTVCPKMLEAGKTSLALRLANMADYTMLNHIGFVYDEFWDDNIELYMTDILTWDQYRAKCSFNWYDYRSNFAGMMDTLTANQLADYVKSVENPQTAFERFLDAHAYVNTDFLNEILGTHYLREMRYSEAKQTLEKVPYAFSRQTNVYKEGLLDYDPFSLRRERWDHALDAKYQFACMMSQCEEEYNHTVSPNRKAMAMLRLAKGIFNSSLAGHCFALCFYQSGGICSPLDNGEQKQREQTKLMCSRAQELCLQAFRMITDEELAAQIQYEYGNFYTVTSWYPQTRAAKYVRAHCDGIWDYHEERSLYPIFLSKW